MTNLRCLMLPHLYDVEGKPGGINRLIEACFRHLPKFGIELVLPEQEYDVKVVHAGMTGGDCDVAFLAGLYFTSDYPANDWEWRVNARVIEACRYAYEIIVPSAWVAEVFQRDMRLTPHAIPHGIDWREWQHNQKNAGYVLWNKNRVVDVCDNSILDVLVSNFTETTFISTLPTTTMNTAKILPPNFKLIPTGAKTPHNEMRRIVQRAGVYLSSTKETFGIGTLEALASGVPVLGWEMGGNVDIVEHGVNGYLAKPGNVPDLLNGLEYCLKHRDILSHNARETVKKWSWQEPMARIADVIRLAYSKKQVKPAVSVVIPVYNKPIVELERAVKSCLKQTLIPEKIVIVNDGSNQSYEKIKEIDKHIVYTEQNNSGVAAARNAGISLTDTPYICCLDADDWIDPDFLKVCVDELAKDNSLGIAYTGLMAHTLDGNSKPSQWPPKFDYDRQLQKQNQVPTCCVFRRIAWERIGGYKSRYCPDGAGSEDAAFWTMFGAIGYGAKKATEAPLFNYSLGSGQVSGNPNYREIYWLQMYPWVNDGQHPFASIARPKRGSHAVRQYDEPLVSVIIPVGPGHEREVENALDSLEMQFFRKWEAVVVWDKCKPSESYLKSYPYVRNFYTSLVTGAGAARNHGVRNARAPLIFFLDADDVLCEPDSLNKFINAWNEQQQIIYSDYLGRAIWNYSEARKAFGNNLLSYNDKNNVAIFRKSAAPYDCARAIRQPEYDHASPTMPYYHWCLVSILMPKTWHDAIGGFDESMDTWEDVDYHWRLAKAGYCFYHLKEAVVLYAYDKGTRREVASVVNESTLQHNRNMIQYIKGKYTNLEVKMCGCTQTKKPPPEIVEQARVNLSDDKFVLIEFHFPGDDTRGTYGKMLISPSGQRDERNQPLDYQGYSRNKGDKFLVHIADQRARPDMFVIVKEEVTLPVVEITPPPEPEMIVAQVVEKPTPIETKAKVETSQEELARVIKKTRRGRRK